MKNYPIQEKSTVARCMAVFIAVFATCLAASQTQSQTTATFYGKANVTINQIDEESNNIDEWQLNSNASLLGVKGSYEISENLQAIYQMEFEVYIDDGKSSSDKGGDTFEQRNIFAGLKGSFGTLIAGRHDSPLKMAQGKIDRFNNQKLGDIKNYLEGEDRLSNILLYTTPSAKGFQATIAAIPGEDSDANRDSLSDGTSISVNYKSDFVTAAIARNDDVDSQDTSRLAVDFNLGNSKIGFILQEAEKIDGSSEEDSWLISGQHKLATSWLLKAQYGRTDYNNSGEDTQFAVGVDKKLNEKSKLFAYYSIIERDNSIETNDDSSFAIGYELKF